MQGQTWVSECWLVEVHSTVNSFLCTLATGWNAPIMSNIKQTLAKSIKCTLWSVSCYIILKRTHQDTFDQVHVLALAESLINLSTDSAHGQELLSCIGFWKCCVPRSKPFELGISSIENRRPVWKRWSNSTVKRIEGYVVYPTALSRGFLQH